MQNDVNRPVLRQKRPVLKNEEIKSSTIVKNNRRMPNLSIEVNANNKTKTNSTSPTLITVIKSHSKTSIVSKKSTKTSHLSKICTRSSRMSTGTDTTSKLVYNLYLSHYFRSCCTFI